MVKLVLVLDAHKATCEPCLLSSLAVPQRHLLLKVVERGSPRELITALQFELDFREGREPVESRDTAEIVF